MSHEGTGPVTDEHRSAARRGEEVAGDLAACEEIIARGLAAFVEVGLALARVRDERLYRETHTTFEDYCRGRWGLSRTYAYDTINSATVVSAIADVAPDVVAPANEAQARELLPLRDRPEDAAAAWSAACGRANANGRRVTARDVGEMVQIRRDAVRPARPRITPFEGVRSGPPLPVVDFDQLAADQIAFLPFVLAQARANADIHVDYQLALEDGTAADYRAWLDSVNETLRAWNRARYTLERRVEAAAKAEAKAAEAEAA